MRQNNLFLKIFILTICQGGFMSVSATVQPTPTSSTLANQPNSQPIIAKAQQAAIQALGSTATAVPQGLVYLDHVLDFIPLAGTASNVITLGLKHLVKDMDPNTSYFKAYIEHLKQKDTSTCLVLAVPFLGTAVKIGATVSSLYPIAKPADVNDEFLGTSTLALRLQQEEQKQVNAFF